MITISRLRTDERTQAFAQRKVASGKSKLEAIRCIKRYIAREVYPLVKANTADVGGSTSALDIYESFRSCFQAVGGSTARTPPVPPPR